MAMNYFSENIDLYTTIFAELKNIGVKVPKVKNFKSCVQKPDKKAPSLDCKMFGISLYKQEWTYDFDYPLPKFLAMSTTYLLNFTKTLGLFRKSGSLVRQRSLRSNLEKGESIEGSDPNDVASLLKQWLRELPEPLIPFYMQDLFVRCQHLVNKQDCTSASLLCCLLLPPDHLHPFKHLMCFLKTFAAHCSENKMGAHNLALMMAPNIFISKAESISKPGSIVIQLHTSVIELLIENSEHIGEVQQSVSLKYSIPLGSKAAASSGIALDYSPSKLTKKFKNDFVSGIKKLVGQNSTSCSNTSDKHWNSPKIGCRSVLSNNTEEMFSTPLRVKDKQTTKPRTLSNHTRRKSFGLLRRKDRARKNSSKRNSFTKRNQAIPKGNSSSRNVSKRNSTSKVQNSGSGSAGSEESSDSSSPQDDYSQTQCELFPNNEEEIYISTCLNNPVLPEADNKDLVEPQISKNMDTKKLEQCEKSHISPQKFNGFNCHRKLFTSSGSSAVNTFVDLPSLNKLFDNNSESMEYQISGEMNLKQGSSSKLSVKIRKSDIEKLGKLKGHCDNDEPNKSNTTSQSKINSKTSFDVGNLDSKIKQKELNMRVKDIDSNYENETNDRSFSNSLNRSKSFIGDPRWKTKYNASTKTPKKTVRSSSLIRGKPNTVKSGLPYQRFYRDLILTPKPIEIKNKMANAADNKQFTPIKLNEPLTTSEKKSEGSSFEQKISLVSNSSKHHSPFSNDSNDNESVRLSSFISPTAGKDSLNTISLKNKGRLSLPLSQKDASCSSSSKIPRFNYSVNKGALNSVEKKSQLSERSGNSKIPLFQTASTSDADTSLNDSLFYTPKQTMQTEYNSTIWLSSNQFLESDTPQTESFNKRESIAMILKNRTGHVRSKVQLYNSREVKSCPTPGSSPPTYQSTPCRRSYSQRQAPSSKSHKPLSILQRCESSNKRVHGKAKVTIPLKPLLSESKASDLELVVNHPLKEVTNINLNGKQNFNYESTPITEKGWNVKHEIAHRVCSDNVLNRSILKRNSFAGRTPAKLSKRVCRSESSPNCPRPGSRLFKTPGQSTVVNQGMKVERHSSFSPVISLSSVKKSDSSVSNLKLKHGDIIDEWLCEF